LRVGAPGFDANAEESWNYAAGVRFERGAGSLEAMAFLVDYENLLGTCTASTGGDCEIGDQYDGGKVRVHGLEFVAAWDASAVLDTSWSLPVSAVYTWTDGEFQTSFSSSFDEWGDVEEGDSLPLVPEHQLTLNAGLEAGRWRTFLTMITSTRLAPRPAPGRSLARSGSTAAQSSISRGRSM
jgi:Fe(3+) dicitrate transport protein